MSRILIAEDDPLIGSFIEKGLGAAGFSSFIASDGEKAQSLSLTGEFDLMILDMSLPRREGSRFSRSSARAERRCRCSS